MNFKIAIASGKGGTGKTTVAIGLFELLSEKVGSTVHLIDCDVEEPNDHLFFHDLQQLHEEDISKLVPVIDSDKCTYCRKCVEYCEFNAIVIIPPVSYAEVNRDLCHSCGACLVACQYDAIREVSEIIGKVTNYKVKEKLKFTEGRLKIGSTMQTMLIRETKKQIAGEEALYIYDAPPGTSCPVVETISDADFVVVVAEPTPFGLHDMKLMIGLLNELKIPFGIVINKAGLGDKGIYDFIQEKNILLLAEIPYNRFFAVSYANGNLSNMPPEIKTAFSKVASKIIKAQKNEGNYYYQR